LKLTLTTLFITLLFTIAKGQPAYNYSRFDFGIAGAVNKPFTDEQTNDYSPSGAASITFNQTPFINYVAELQVGQFTGNSNYGAALQRNFRTRFLAPDIRIQLQAGQFVNYYNSRFLNALKNLYISGGIGLLYGRTNANSNTLYGNENVTVNSQSSNYSMFIPARLGYEFKIFNSDSEPFMKVDIAYQFNYMLRDRLDGIKSGNSNDSFNQLTLGIKFAVPGMVSYKKPL
jgi:hypothetical protein